MNIDIYIYFFDIVFLENLNIEFFVLNRKILSKKYKMFLIFCK